MSTNATTIYPTPVSMTIQLAASADDVYNNFSIALALSSLAGASTGIGGLMMVLQNDLSVHRLGMWQGAAAGFMLSVSFFDLAPSVLADLDLLPAIVYFAIGAAIFLALKQCIPEPDMDAFAKTSDSSVRKVLWSGLLTAAGISLHNFPEGIAVCMASLRGLKFGVPLAIAIGLHNIPEGMAVALPLYFATRDKYYAVRMAFLSGMAEPAGVLFVLALITVTGTLTKSFISISMSAVTGIMVVLSLTELLPQAVRHAGKKDAAVATTLGLAVMTILLRAIDSLGFEV